MQDPGLPEGREGAAYLARAPRGPRAPPGTVTTAAGEAGTGAKDSALRGEREEGLNLSFRAP